MTNKPAEQLHGELEHAQLERGTRRTRYSGMTFLLGAFLIIAAACSAPAKAQPTRLVFGFGVGARNVLDTNAGTFTYDMVRGDLVVIPFPLSIEEITRVVALAGEEDFFSMPQRLPEIRTWTEGAVPAIHPCSTWYLAIETAGQSNEVTWNDCWYGLTEPAARAMKLARFIGNLMRSKPEYRMLPARRGGYR